MSSLTSGINSIASYTSQIENLDSSSTESLPDSETYLYTLEQNFNQMLNDFVAAINNNDEEDDEDDSSGVFDFIISSNQAYIQNLSQQNTSEDSAQQINFYDLLGSGSSYLDYVSSLQDNNLALQALINTDIPV